MYGKCLVFGVVYRVYVGKIWWWKWCGIGD